MTYHIIPLIAKYLQFWYAAQFFPVYYCSKVGTDEYSILDGEGLQTDCWTKILFKSFYRITWAEHGDDDVKTYEKTSRNMKDKTWMETVIRMRWRTSKMHVVRRQVTWNELDVRWTEKKCRENWQCLRKCCFLVVIIVVFYFFFKLWICLH